MKDIISVLIHTRNEEENIGECIESAKLLSDVVIVIDMESSDRTQAIATKSGAAVISFPYSSYVEPAREFGINHASTDWVFILDADERIMPESAKEIQSVIRPSQFSNYKIPRMNIFGHPPAGGWLKHGGWWPDYQIRLINRKYFQTWPKEIHSTPQIQGNVGYLKEPILHYFHGDIAEMVKKTIIFESFESELLFKAKKNVTAPTFFRKFLGEFYRRFLLHLGFLDGDLGIIESIYQAFSKTITYLYLYEKQKKTRTL